MSDKPLTLDVLHVRQLADLLDDLHHGLLAALGTFKADVTNARVALDASSASYSGPHGSSGPLAGAFSRYAESVESYGGRTNVELKYLADTVDAAVNALTATDTTNDTALRNVDV